MGKLKEEDLQRLKRIQDVDDDDTSLDINTRRRLQKPVHAGSSDVEADVDQSEDQKRKNARSLAYVLGGVVVVFLLILAVITFYKPVKTVPTIDELHDMNLAGKLDESEGYVYNGFSFINLGGVWYSRVQKGSTIYDITFNNGPYDVEDIAVEGALSSAFDRGGDVFITFDPDARGTKYITVANAGLSLALAKGFQYNLTATCTDPDRPTCQKNGAVSCGDKDKAVIYFKETADTKIVLAENCVTVQGTGPELVRAKDRLLMRWYGIMN